MTIHRTKPLYETRETRQLIELEKQLLIEKQLKQALATIKTLTKESGGKRL